jgi:hypothetical protein
VAPISELVQTSIALFVGVVEAISSGPASAFPASATPLLPPLEVLAEVALLAPVPLLVEELEVDEELEPAVELEPVLSDELVLAPIVGAVPVLAVEEPGWPELVGPDEWLLEVDVEATEPELP